MNEHELIDGTLITVPGGIVAKCTCGWVSDIGFSGMMTSLRFREHQQAAKDAATDAAIHDRPWGSGQ